MKPEFRFLLVGYLPPGNGAPSGVAVALPYDIAFLREEGILNLDLFLGFLV
jgi:hypothetical protein